MGLNGIRLDVPSDKAPPIQVRKSNSCDCVLIYLYMVRYFVGLVLLAIVLMASGCIYIPGPLLTDVGTKTNLPPPSSLISNHGDIHIGATRQHVRDVLGDPDKLGEDVMTEIWYLHPHQGWLWCLLPMVHFWGDSTGFISGDVTLTVSYDGAWRVQNASVKEPDYLRRDPPARSPPPGHVPVRNKVASR